MEKYLRNFNYRSITYKPSYIENSVFNCIAIMSAVEFFNVKDKDVQVAVKKTKSAFHARRAIIVQDPYAKTLWIVYGSLVSDKIKEFAQLNAKSLNAKLKFKYKLVTVKTDERKEKLQYFLDIVQNPPKSKTKKTVQTKKREKKHTTTIPPVKVPAKLKKRVRSLVKADEKNSGPMIPEFQIAYYEENPIKKICDKIKLLTSDDDLFALHNHINTIVLLINENASKKRVQKELQISIKELITALFE